MGSISDYLENELLDHALKVGSYTPPTNIYIALSTASPGDDASGLTEPSGNGYARVLCNGWDTAASRQTKNTSQIDFPTPTGAWGTITHVAVMDAISGGNMLAWGALNNPKAIGIGDDTYFAAQAIILTFNSGHMSNYLANVLLDHVFKVGSYTPPTNIYAALCTAAITDTDSGSTITEPSGGSYARKNHNSWNTASGGVSNNNGDITFVQATGDWGTITYLAITDALTVGNVLFYTQADSPKVISSGDTAKIVDQSLAVTMD